MGLGPTLRDSGLRAKFIYVFMLIVPMTLWYSVRDCYFALWIYDRLFWVEPALLLIFGASTFAWVIRARTKKARVLAAVEAERQVESEGASEGASKGTGGHVSNAAFVGLLLGFCGMMLVNLGALSLVYVTASAKAEFIAPIAIRNTGGGGYRWCRYFMSFYNQALERDVTICADSRNIGGAKSGDSLIFDQQVGPLGTRLIAIRRRSN